MTSQHQATPDEWAQQSDWAQKQFSSSFCIVELLHRVEALEAIDHHPLVAAVRAQSKTVAHLGNRVERLKELHAAVVDLNQRFSLDPLVDRIEALEATQHAHIAAAALRSSAAAELSASQFTAKYLFTACNIVQDSFCYDPDGSSVWFETEISHPVIPGGNIKIAHHWGEEPDSKCCSTINYKVLLTSETEIKSLRVRAIRVDVSDSAPAPAADARQLTLVERVAMAINPRPDESPTLYTDEARAAIREVAAWLLEQDPEPGALGRLLGQLSTPWGVMADLLRHEANQ